MLTGGHTTMWSILTVGLFNSIMFPTIFRLGVAELGPLTGSGSGLLNNGYRRRCNPARHPGRHCGSRRDSSRFCYPRSLLLVHYVLWAERLKAEQRKVRKQ